jgi:hypothetical protein
VSASPEREYARTRVLNTIVIVDSRELQILERVINKQVEGGREKRERTGDGEVRMA